MLKTAKGFTLIELLLVILLIGLIANTISFPSLTKNAYENAKEETERFTTLVDLAAEYSVLNNLLLGIEISQQSYRFLAYDGEIWIPIDKPPFTSRELPQWFELELNLDGLEWQAQNLLSTVQWQAEEEQSLMEEEQERLYPQIYILPSGEISAFELQLNYSEMDSQQYQDDITFVIRGKFTTPLEVIDGNTL